MIALLLLSGSFLIIMFIGMVIIIVQFKKWAELKEVESKKRIDDLQKRIDETQSLFRTEITGLLSKFNNLLK